MCAHFYLVVTQLNFGEQKTKDDVWVANHVSDSEPSSVPIQNHTLQVKHTAAHRQADFEGWSFYIRLFFLFPPSHTESFIHVCEHKLAYLHSILQ